MFHDIKKTLCWLDELNGAFFFFMQLLIYLQIYSILIEFMNDFIQAQAQAQ